MENTVIVDAHGLSGPVRIITLYRLKVQTSSLEELEPCIRENTIIIGDLNASVKKNTVVCHQIKEEKH